MASEVVCGLVFRLLLPVCLAAGEGFFFFLNPHFVLRILIGLYFYVLGALSAWSINSLYILSDIILQSVHTFM